MILILLLSIISIILAINWIVDWTTHISMCLDEQCLWGWGNFEKFIDQYGMHNGWYIDRFWPKSIFSRSGNDWYIHASIIKFNGKCMILGPLSWVLFKIWLKRQTDMMKGDEVIRRISWN